MIVRFIKLCWQYSSPHDDDDDDDDYVLHYICTWNSASSSPKCCTYTLNCPFDIIKHIKNRSIISSTDQCLLDICTNIQLLGISFSSFLFSFSFLFFPFTIAIPIRPIQSLFFLSLYLSFLFLLYTIKSLPRFAVSSTHITIHISIF